MISDLIRDVSDAVFQPAKMERNTIRYLVNRAADEVHALLEIQGRDRIEDGLVPLSDASRRLDTLSLEVARIPDHQLGEVVLEVAFVINELKVKFNRRTEVPRGVLRAA